MPGPQGMLSEVRQRLHPRYRDLSLALYISTLAPPPLPRPFQHHTTLRLTPQRPALIRAADPLAAAAALGSAEHHQATGNR